MPQVSQKQLQKDVLLRIHKQFSELLLDLKNTKLGAEFLDELFTNTEKIMLAKRLSVLMMLFEEIPQSTIAQLLGMTRTTVWKYATQLDRGGYQHMRYVFQKQKDREELWKTLCELSRDGLPPYSGRGRWSYLYKQTKNLHKNTR